MDHRSGVTGDHTSVVSGDHTYKPGHGLPHGRAARIHVAIGMPDNLEADPDSKAMRDDLTRPPHDGAHGLHDVVDLTGWSFDVACVMNGPTGGQARLGA